MIVNWYSKHLASMQREQEQTAIRSSKDRSTTTSPFRQQEAFITRIYCIHYIEMLKSTKSQEGRRLRFFSSFCSRHFQATSGPGRVRTQHRKTFEALNLHEKAIRKEGQAKLESGLKLPAGCESRALAICFARRCIVVAAAAAKSEEFDNCLDFLPADWAIHAGFRCLTFAVAAHKMSARHDSAQSRAVQQLEHA